MLSGLPGYWLLSAPIGSPSRAALGLCYQGCLGIGCYQGCLQGIGWTHGCFNWAGVSIGQVFQLGITYN